MNAAEYRVEAQLRDGLAVTIRAIRPDDRERIVEAFGRLSPETVYMRLFSFKKALTDAEFQAITEVDFERRASLVVTRFAGAAEKIIAAASFIRGEAPDRAEVSFIVADEYQGRGIGRRLLEHLVRIARDRGITRFEAQVLSDNAGMLAVFERSGLPLERRSEGGVVTVTRELGPAAPA
jgi:RimJ/RimL family protein N-acetyltransferase